jgi:hypothetical protein
MPSSVVAPTLALALDSDETEASEQSSDEETRVDNESGTARQLSAKGKLDTDVGTPPAIGCRSCRVKLSCVT